eukprot:33166_1
MIRRTVSVKRLSADLGRSSLEERATQKRRISESQEFAVDTILFNSEPSEFEGAEITGQAAESIVNYNESAGDVAEAVKTSVSAVLFQKEKSGGLRGAFEKVAEAMRVESRFFHVADEAIATALGIDTSSEGVTILRSFDEKVVKFTGKIEDGLKSFLDDESFPLCGKIGPENYMKYQQRKLPLVLVAVDFNDKDNEKSTQGLISNAREVAKAYKGRMSFVYIDSETFKEEVEKWGFSGNLPGIIIADADKRYKYTGKEFTESSIKDFVVKFAAEKLTEFRKSEDDGPVMEETGVGNVGNEEGADEENQDKEER